MKSDRIDEVSVSIPNESQKEKPDSDSDTVVEEKPKKDPATGMRWVHNGVPVISGPGSRLV